MVDSIYGVHPYVRRKPSISYLKYGIIVGGKRKGIMEFVSEEIILNDVG